MSEHAPLGGKLLTKPFLFFALLFMISLAILATRFIFGLGSVTHLSDGYPWGIWIVIDVMIGTAFGCAGYAVALLVYVLNKGEYHPLVRSAVLAGMFGYTLAGTLQPNPRNRGRKLLPCRPRKCMKRSIT